VIIFFFLRYIIFPSIIVDSHATFVPDYANVLVKVVAIFGVIKRVGYLQLHLHTTSGGSKGGWVGHGPHRFLAGPLLVSPRFLLNFTFKFV